MPPFMRMWPTWIYLVGSWPPLQHGWHLNLERKVIWISRSTKMVSSLTLGPQDLTNPYSLVIFCRCHQWRPHPYVYSQDKHTLAWLCWKGMRLLQQKSQQSHPWILHQQGSASHGFTYICRGGPQDRGGGRSCPQDQRLCGNGCQADEPRKWRKGTLCWLGASPRCRSSVEFRCEWGDLGESEIKEIEEVSGNVDDIDEESDEGGDVVSMVSSHEVWWRFVSTSGWWTVLPGPPPSNALLQKYPKLHSWPVAFSCEGFDAPVS